MVQFDNNKQTVKTIKMLISDTISIQKLNNR